MFSASKDTDFLIMEKMDDVSLLNFCKLNHHTIKLCDNDLFWEKRTKRNFEKLYRTKTQGESWKEFYLNILYYIYKLQEDFKYEYDYEDDDDYYDDDETPKATYNKLKASVNDKVKLRLEDPLPRNKVYDISFIDEEGSGIKVINRPTEGSKKKQVGDLNIYSENSRAVYRLRRLIGNYELSLKK